MTIPSASAEDITELYAIVVDVGDQIAATVESLSSPDIAIPRSSWTVGEAAVHLATANAHMADIAADARPDRHGDGTRAGLAAANQQVLDRAPKPDLAQLARMIDGQAAQFVRAARDRPATDIVDTPLGTMPLPTLASYLLAHMLSHGTAIGDAAGAPTLVRPRHVEFVLPFLTTVMPRLLRPERARGVNRKYEIRLRGGSRFTALIENATVTINDGGSRAPDCVISAEPVAFFLLAMGNRPQWPLVLRGKLSCYGRRPWLGTGFVGRFDVP